MIAREDDRAGGRNLVEADDLELPEEHAAHDAEEPRQDPIHHLTILSARAPRTCDDRQSSSVPSWTSAPINPPATPGGVNIGRAPRASFAGSVPTSAS